MPGWEEKLMQLLKDESFQAWLAGRATEPENFRWNAWLNADERHRDLYNAAIEIWRKVQFPPEPPQDKAAAWEQLQSRLGFTRAPAAPGAARDRVSHREIHRGMQSFQWLAGVTTAVAAMLLLVVFVWPGVLFQRSGEIVFDTVRTAYGEQIQINLPDQSRVVLNANSVLQYPRQWDSHTPRQVKLSGEAYFEVAKGQGADQTTFVVETADGRVTVLGTRFVVHERGMGTRVTLSEGEVQVNARDIRGNGETAGQTRLLPGQRVVFRKGEPVLRPTADAHRQVVWWHNAFVLNQTPLAEFVELLRDTYGVSIYVADTRLLKRVLSGSMESTSLEVVLDALGKLLQVPVHYRGTQVVLGGDSDRR